MPTTDPETDNRWMRRAIRLAMNGRGRVEPNPMVGCVLVKGDRVIGEGYHQQFGGPHAEPNALASCTESAHGATAYVTLEPCCHTNKKTPPCAPRLIEAKIARVVIGCLDPNPEVNGNGVAMLRGAGMRVDTSLLEAAAKQLIAPFLKRVRHRRPYVTLKWAQSADGKVAGPGGRRVQISNETSTRAVHELRARSDAILVGINTVLSDDPLLTARGTEARRPLRRLVLDTKLRIPFDSRLVRTAREYPLVIYTSPGLPKNNEVFNLLMGLGVEVISVNLDAAGRPRIDDLLAWQDVGISHLLVEPGPTLAAAFFAAGLADRLWVICSPASIGDPTAPAAAPVPANFIMSGELDLKGDRLTEYLNPFRPVYFDACESADLTLARR